ncbi:MAG: UDP-3-O-(3-hydroxymyristoyl)glucosamine N-acyltransferase [Planctomycetota bacterium]
MPITISKIAQLVNGTVSGNRNCLITGVAGLEEAQPGEITFLANKKYLPLLKTTRASAVLVDKQTKVPDHLNAISVKNPDLSFAQIIEYFKPEPPALSKGIHSRALVAKNVKLGKNVCIQPYAVLQPGSKIGAGTVIYPNVYIGQGVSIGKNCCLYPNVVIREKCVIGDNVIIHSGTVIGSDGFGYTLVNGTRRKIPQIGIVVIEDEVEIGANVTIDRARFGQTIIRKGVKIDNLVQVAHNVEIGENSVLVAQVGISGSTKIGQNVIMAGRSGAVGHIQIGDNVTVAGCSVATKNIPAGMIVSGFPARPHHEELHIQAALHKLPELLKIIKQLQAEIKNLKK